jgi:hypothetical protein
MPEVCKSFHACEASPFHCQMNSEKRSRETHESSVKNNSVQIGSIFFSAMNISKKLIAMRKPITLAPGTIQMEQKIVSSQKITQVASPLKFKKNVSLYSCLV